MHTSQMLILLLSSQGYWFGGQEGTVAVRWATQQPPTAAVLAWEVLLGEVRLTGERVALGTGPQPATLTITPPEVRARTSLRLVYRLLARDGEKELTRGEATIHVYPRSLLAGIEKRLAGKRLLVWDAPGKLPRMLDSVKLGHLRIEHDGDLQFAHADIILVGLDQISAGPFSQSTLLGQAEAGAGVVLFRQSRAKTLVGYSVSKRAAPSRLEWRIDHPLLHGIGLEDLQSWLEPSTMELDAIRLPANEPALEVCFWPREVPGEQAVPIDALLVTKAVGKGRIILCQIPLGDWQTDPRSQILLANVLDYLSTRAEPTPPPGQRRSERPRLPETVPTITIPPGGIP